MAEVNGNRISVGNAGETAIALESGAKSGALQADFDSIDPDLREVVEAWQHLNVDGKMRILSIVRSEVEE